MRVEERNRMILLVLVFMPALFWLAAVKKTETLYTPKIKAIFEVAKHTHEKPVLIAAMVGGLIIGIVLAFFISKLGKVPFEGAYYKQHLRGAKQVTADQLRTKTREKKTEQIDIAGIPMPTKIEALHLLVTGATGAGKSVLFRRAAYSGMKRRDRFIITDMNGDMLSKFYRKGDVILNPYDERTVGWSFFNEIRNDYDFQRYAYSLVPLGENSEAEEWNSYARLLLRETARKLHLIGNPSVRELFRWTTIADPEHLKAFLEGTAAESLFVGADRALASARFVLSAKLPEHLNMPAGDFSLRDWLADPTAGNLYITCREDQAPALRPLISAWVDVLCTSILSLDEDANRRIWMLLDELDSLDKLPSLEPALTKGRKHGLRIIAGIQSTAQLDSTYGVHDAQTLRSCFRSLVVLGNAKADSKTCEDMSKSLGKHEVVRDKFSKSAGKSVTRNTNEETKEEFVVTASQIASLEELTGYVAFAGMAELAKITLEPQSFKKHTPAFVERVA